MLAATLVHCSAETPRGACGESFCLPRGAQLVAKRTPVEDFNLYQVEWNGGSFLIYEGNAPDEGDGAATILSLPLDPQATLRRDSGHGSVLLRIDRQWPNYLQIAGPCLPGDRCAAATLASLITRR